MSRRGCAASNLDAHLRHGPIQPDRNWRAKTLGKIDPPTNLS
jgi:hypothetical protein